MQRVMRILTPAVLTAAPAALIYCAVTGTGGTAALTIAMAIAALAVFLAKFELKKPKPEEILPVVVMAAIAAVGRMAFAPFPSFKPVTAIVMISAIAFGPESGFLTGALAALASNMFFGQGAWTPWQMYSWGMTGYAAGVLRNTRVMKSGAGAAAVGFVLAMGYGFIMDTWTLVGFVSPINWATALAVYGAGLPLNLIHGASTVIFLGVLYIPWRRKLDRIKRKYGL